MKDLSYCLKLLVHKAMVVLSSYWQGHKVSTAITPNMNCLDGWILCRHCLSLLACPVPSQPASQCRDRDQGLQAPSYRERSFTQGWLRAGLHLEPAGPSQGRIDDADMLVVRKGPLDYRLCLSCISLACLGSWAKYDQIRAADLKKCLFFLCSAGAFSGFNFLTDCSTGSNTSILWEWASTVQGSQQWQWGTSAALPWVHLVWKISVSYPWFPWSVWGQF